jgi:hypothetical protein
MKKLLGVIAVLAVLAAPAISDEPAPKHSEFVFARLQVANRLDYLRFWDEAPWHHDYPYSDEFFTGLLHELTGIDVNKDSYRIVQISSPDLFNYPFLYFSEPGFMVLNDKEIAILGEYIRRGGFIMADDFRTANYLHGPEELEVLRAYLKRAVPEFELVKLDIHHPIFHAFYDIDTLKMDPPYGREPCRETPGFIPEFWGLSDEKGNLRLIANYNNDIGDFWKYLDQGDKPLKESSRAIQLGINYVVYAMSH